MSYSASPSRPTRYTPPPTYQSPVRNNTNSRLALKLESQRGSANLNLADCFVGDEGCPLIVQFLDDNPQVTSLELRGNNICAEGVKVLAEVFKSPSQIKSVNMEWNNIGMLDSGVEILADSLALNNSVVILDLRNNRIGPQGAEGLAKMLRTNTALQKVDLRWNEIGPTGGRALLQSLQSNKSLTQLELAGNKIPEDIIEEIDLLLKKGGGSQAQFSNKFQQGQKNETMKEMQKEQVKRKVLEQETQQVRESKIEQSQEPQYKENFQMQYRDPYKIYQKERDFSYEVQQKFDSQVLAHSRTEAKIGEIEVLLEREKARTREMKNDLLKELDQEKLMRSHAEDSLLQLKEEIMKHELEDSKLMQEFELKINNEMHDKASLQIEINRLKEQFDRSKMNESDKIKSLEDKLLATQKNHTNLEDQSKIQLRKIAQEKIQERNELVNEWEKKFMIAEEANRSAKKTLEDAEAEAKEMRAAILSFKIQHEETAQKIESDIRDDEEKKFNSAIRNLEQKIKNLEEARENLQRSNQELQRKLVKSQKTATDHQLQLQNEINSTTDQKNELWMQINEFITRSEQLQSELQINENQIEKSEQNKSLLQKKLHQREEVNNEQIDKVQMAHLKEKKAWEQIKDSQSRKLNDLEKQLQRANLELNFVKSNHERLSETLKETMSKVVHATVMEHLKFIEGSRNTY